MTMNRIALFAGAMMLSLGIFLPPESALARKYAAVVLEADTGRILFGTNMDAKRYPASLTKMMTLYMVFDALDRGRLRLKQRLPVSRTAANRSPSKLGLKPGQTISVQNAIYALVTKSANDVATVLAEGLAGSEERFARKMTRKARSLGMVRTTFRNASGLPNWRQWTTARDMATLGRRLLRDFPRYYRYFSTEKFSYNGRKYRNHNKLLTSYKGTDGIKTGYIRASGFNLVASVERNGYRLIAVVIGGKTAKSRDEQITKLLDKGFRVLDILRRPELPKKRPDLLVAHSGQRSFASASRTPVAPHRTAGAPTGSPTKSTVTLLRGTRPTNTAGPVNSVAAVARPVARTQARLYASASYGSYKKPIPRPDRGQRFAAMAQPVLRADVSPDMVAFAVDPVIPRRRDWSTEARWGVQVGAYRRHDPAAEAGRKAKQVARHLLADTELVVDPIRGRSSILYRARLLGLNEKEARRACRFMKSKKLDCMPLEMSLAKADWNQS